MSVHFAWGVKFVYTDVDGTVRTGLFGRFAFPRYEGPDCLGGYKTAVFRTRRQAREALPNLRSCGLYDRVAAVRVAVDVEAWHD